ncbi:MAG TPA: ATP-binding protein [Prolixibacteraceae bacterium]|nr:ATP-binding protein [Prolixibacteraceae bacterium]
MERKLIIASELKNIEYVRNFVRGIFKDFSLNMNYFNRIFLGISEAVHNAILHGNQLNPEKNVFLKMRLEKNKIYIEIKDEGNGFCSENLSDPRTGENIKKEQGRGIFLIQSMADKLSFQEDGRKVLIQFKIPE